MCAALLTQLKNRTHRWPTLTAVDLISAANENVFPVLATEYETGGTLALREAKPSSAGKKITHLVGKPFIYGNFDGPADIGGFVVDAQSGDPKQGVQIQLRKTVARIDSLTGLPCYVDANSASATITRLPKGGEFGVVEIRWNDPDENWVWLKVDTPYGDGWINARSGGGWYARIYDSFVTGGSATTDAAGKFTCRVTRRHMYRARSVLNGYLDGETAYFIPPRTDLSMEIEPIVGAVPEMAITDLLEKFKNFDYVSGSTVLVGQYPYPIEGLASTTAPLAVVESSTNTRYNDCTTFSEALLVKAWKKEHPTAFVWNWTKHKQWMIRGTDAKDRYSPIEAAESSGMVLTPVLIEPSILGSDAVPEVWTLVQGFQNPPTGDRPAWALGHSFIIVDRMPSPGSNRNDDKLLILESQIPSEFKTDGPGFRMIADIDDVTNFNPGRDWWNQEDVPTWGQVKTNYPYIMMARLKVYDVNWVR